MYKTNNSTSATAKKYVPDAKALGVLCEQNYVRLMKLTPNDMPADAFVVFSVSNILSYQLTMKECFKYTSTIEFKQVEPILPNYLMPKMLIRLYHDARMAEVLSSQNLTRIKPRYDYPNDGMMQPNEKWQINHFLRDWSKLCLEIGETEIDLSSF